MDRFLIERKRSFDESYEGKQFNSSMVDDEYQRDRARVIHSFAFRRLQAKTQILALGESDFYRTRLTHSLEVAQIGSSISFALKEKYKEDDKLCNVIPSPYLIETIGFAHDLGHPPFGHGGERALNECMRNHGGFEGNGHTLRIAARLGEYSPAHGLDLTRRSLLGLIKYPVLYSKVVNSSNNKADDPPKCILDSEKDILEWVLSPFNLDDQKLFQQITFQSEKDHHTSTYKSLDCSIMELADDIAYGVHDLEDALSMKLVTREMWDAEVVPKIELLSDFSLQIERETYEQRLFSSHNNERKHAISKLVGLFVNSIDIKETNNSFSSLYLRLNVELQEEARKALKVLKDFVYKYVILKPQVKAFEFKGRMIINKLFEVYRDHPEFLPSQEYKEYQESPIKERILCDYIAGMTDTYAAKQYQRLFIPDQGSIYDL